MPEQRQPSEDQHTSVELNDLDSSAMSPAAAEAVKGGDRSTTTVKSSAEVKHDQTTQSIARNIAG